MKNIEIWRYKRGLIKRFNGRKGQEITRNLSTINLMIFTTMTKISETLLWKKKTERCR